MEEQNITREFANVEQAFACLPQAEQERCIRVSEYAEALFLQTCASDVYSGETEVQLLLDTELRDVLKQAARYHSLGKALVPPLYHSLAPDFTAEELALYRAYPQEGARLVQQLLAPQYVGQKRTLTLLANAVQTHAEAWDGSGFPAASSGAQIPLFGRVIAAAIMLDDVASQTRSEGPFPVALAQLAAAAGTTIDPTLAQMAQAGRAKLKRIFQKFITQSQAIPTTECLIRRRANRPFSLFYRAIVSPRKGETIALEAQMRFKQGGEWVEIDQVQDILKAEGAHARLGLYFVQELCDTVNRLATCNLKADCIALTLPQGWLNKRGADKQIQAALEAARVAPKSFCVVVPHAQWLAATKTMQDNMRKLAALGCGVMLSQVTEHDLDVPALCASGATIVRVAPSVGVCLKEPATTNALTALQAAGVHIWADGIEKTSHIALFARNKITAATSVLHSDFQPEDAMVQAELIKQTAD